MHMLQSEDLKSLNMAMLLNMPILFVNYSCLSMNHIIPSLFLADDLSQQNRPVVWLAKKGVLIVTSLLFQYVYLFFLPVLTHTC